MHFEHKNKDKLYYGHSIYTCKTSARTEIRLLRTNKWYLKISNYSGGVILNYFKLITVLSSLVIGTSTASQNCSALTLTILFYFSKSNLKKSKM